MSGAHVKTERRWLSQEQVAEYLGVSVTVSYTHLDVYKRQGILYPRLTVCGVAPEALIGINVTSDVPDTCVPALLIKRIVIFAGAEFEG